MVSVSVRRGTSSTLALMVCELRCRSNVKRTPQRGRRHRSYGLWLHDPRGSQPRGSYPPRFVHANAIPRQSRSWRIAQNRTGTQELDHSSLREELDAVVAERCAADFCAVTRSFIGA